MRLPYFMLNSSAIVSSWNCILKAMSNFAQCESNVINLKVIQSVISTLVLVTLNLTVYRLSQNCPSTDSQCIDTDRCILYFPITFYIFNHANIYFNFQIKVINCLQK